MTMIIMTMIIMTMTIMTMIIIGLWIFLRLPIKVLYALIDADIFTARLLTQIYKRAICTTTWNFDKNY